MDQIEALGKRAAAAVAGVGVVQQVRVEFDEDADARPVYRFSFLIDPNRLQTRAGLLRTRLIQKLRDELVSRQDGHLPVIKILNQADWDQEARDRSC